MLAKLTIQLAGIIPKLLPTTGGTTVSCIFSVTWLEGDVKEPTRLSKRVGHVVPGVVVYLKFHPTFHAWVGWVSEIKYELIAAARGALTN